MADSGESSRKSQKAGRGSVQHRRQAKQERDRAAKKPPTGLELRSINSLNGSGEKNPAGIRGDVCHLGDELQPQFKQGQKDKAQKDKAQKNLLGWLFGRQSPQRPQALSRRELRRRNSKLNSATLNSTTPAQRPTLHDRPTDLDGHASHNRPTDLESSQNHRDSLSTESRGADSRLSSLNGGAQRSPKNLTSQPPSRMRSQSGENGQVAHSQAPIPLRGARPVPPRPRSKEGTITRFQPHQTQIQGQTSLQHNTVLQGHDTAGLLNGRPATRRKREPEKPSRPRSRNLAIALYAARMLILSVGVGVLAGTVLAAWNPANNPFLGNNSLRPTIKEASTSSKGAQPSQPTGQLQLAQEIAPLKISVQKVMQQYPGFVPGIFLIDLDNNNYLNLSGNNSFAAASTIKVPILVAFFQDVDAGKIRLDEKLTMTKNVVAQGSGEMQYLPVGSSFTALEVATQMITISDNTATNMLITRLGGMAALNQRFKSWGLSATALNKLLPDLEGTNTTSPQELASLLVRVSQGDLVTLRARDRMLDIMRRTVNNSQLPQGLGAGATIAHKTGDIGTLIGDVGLIDMPNGKRYAAAVLVKRDFNDDRAYDLVQHISRALYQNMSAATPTRPAVSPLPSATPINPDADTTDTQNGDDTPPNPPEQSPPPKP